MPKRMDHPLSKQAVLNRIEERLGRVVQLAKRVPKPKTEEIEYVPGTSVIHSCPHRTGQQL